MRVWGADSGMLLAVMQGHEKGVTSVAVSPNGHRIVSGSWDTTIRVWDTDTARELAVMRGHPTVDAS